MQNAGLMNMNFEQIEQTLKNYYEMGILNQSMIDGIAGGAHNNDSCKYALAYGKELLEYMAEQSVLDGERNIH